MGENWLYYGDNLEILPEITDKSIDLVYLDPPFNSNESYNVLFKDKSGEDSQAQIQAFDDMWRWSPEADQCYDWIQSHASQPVADTMEGMWSLLGRSDMMAYLVEMVPRLMELHRILKPTGSLFLHCDPTASHYLKLVLDAVFGPKQFRNEVIWRRTGSHAPSKSFGSLHDTLLFYSKSDKFYFQPIRAPYTQEHVRNRYIEDEQGRFKFSTGGNILTGAGASKGDSGQPWRGFDPSARGRHWAIPGYLAEQMDDDFEDHSTTEKLEALYQVGLIEIKDGATWPHPVKYLSESDGYPVGDIWAYQPGTAGVLWGTDEGIDADVAWLGPTDTERVNFQTQKPIGLLRRIIQAACPSDGTVLDPFAGCGSTIIAAHDLNRRWIGIDITFIAIDLIQQRLEDIFEAKRGVDYETQGIPVEFEAAKDLFERDKFDFERWAARQVGAQPNEKQTGDKGIDGIARFMLDDKNKKSGKVIVSVKGGKDIKPAYVRDLIGAVDSDPRAHLGVMVTLEEPTTRMHQAADQCGYYTWPFNGAQFPKIQIITVEELLAGKRPSLPPLLSPYTHAQPPKKGNQPTLGV